MKKTTQKNFAGRGEASVAKLQRELDSVRKELHEANENLERIIHERTLAFRKSEERFRLMVMEVKDYAIFMLDPEGYIATWNAGARRFKGYEASEIIGQHFSKFYP